MADYKPRPFTCWICGWVLGEISRPANGPTRLQIYRTSHEYWLPSNPETPAWFSFAASIEQGSVYCEHCGQENNWDINSHGLEQLIKRVRRRGARLLVPIGAEVEG